MRLQVSRPQLGRVLASALLVALAVAPAGGVGGAADAGSQLSSCDPMAPADAAVASGSGEASLGRGSPVREPDLGEVRADLPSSAKGRAGANFRLL
jgi:hypothetical protein